MANNEDYLDSLLKAAAANDDPNSAINKVREFSAKLDEPLEADEASEYALDSDISSLLSDLSNEISENGVSDSSADEINAEAVSVFKDLESLVSEDELNNLEAENFLLDEPLDLGIESNEEEISVEADLQAIEEETVIEGEVADEVALDEPVLDETDSDATALEEITDGVDESVALEEPLSEETSTTDLDASLEGLDILSDISLEDVSTEENTDEKADEHTDSKEEGSDESIDIDALLQSDFSGEIDMSEISSLLDNAEAFANEEGTDEASIDAGESSDDTVMVDDLLSELTGTDDTAKEDSDGTGSTNQEMEIDLSDIGNLEGDLGIFDKNDISALAGDETGDNGELDEISSLLKSIDSNTVSESDDTDMLDLLNEAVSKQEQLEKQEEIDKARADALAEYNEFKEKKAKEDKKKNKKSLFGKLKKKKDENVVKEKKKGKLSKAMEFLTASEDDDESSEDNLLNPTDVNPETQSDGSEGFEDVPGENKEILEEVDKEEDGKKGKKKKKKKKGKGKEASEGEGEDEAEEGEEGEDSGKKKKKAPKEKKERKPLILDIDTGKPLSKKNVKLIFFMAATLLVLIVLFSKLVPGILINSSARRAYYKGDYETTYNSFFGEKLSDSDQILFDRSEVILKMSHKFDAYNAYMNMNMQTEALDQLLQAVANYEKWLIKAETTGAVSEFNKEYTKILGALSMSFNLTENDAKEICALATDTEYSLKIYSIITGTEYINPNVPLPGPFVPPVEEAEEEEIQYEDLLAEEGN